MRKNEEKKNEVHEKGPQDFHDHFFVMWFSFASYTVHDGLQSKRETSHSLITTMSTDF